MKFIFKYSILLFTCFQLGCISTRNLSGAKKIVRNLHQEQVLSDGYFGAYVIDGKTNKALFSYNEDQLFTPASTLKCLTLLESLQYFGDSLPIVNFTKSNDTLNIWGTGFPHFMEHLPTKNPFQKIVTNKNTSIVINFPSSHDCPKFGAGWAWDDAKYSFQKPLSSFPILGHYIDDEKMHQLTSLGLANEFTNGPHLPERKLFPKLLNIHYPIVNIDNKSLPEKYRSLKQHADSIYRQMMYKSDNFIADQLIIQRAIDQNNNCAFSNLLASIKSSYPIQFKMDKIVDGSGLSRYNQLSPKSLVFIINEIDQLNSGKAIEKYFPKIGSDILENYEIPDGVIVRGKTGSMSKVYCLAGRISKNNNIYYFVIMSNHFKGSVSEQKQTVGQFLTKITTLIQ